MPNAPENRAGYARRVRQDQPCWRRSIFGTRNGLTSGLTIDSCLQDFSLKRGRNQ